MSRFGWRVDKFGPLWPHNGLWLGLCADLKRYTWSFVQPSICAGIIIQAFRLCYTLCSASFGLRDTFEHICIICEIIVAIAIMGCLIRFHFRGTNATMLAHLCALLVCLLSVELAIRNFRDVSIAGIVTTTALTASGEAIIMSQISIPSLSLFQIGFLPLLLKCIWGWPRGKIGLFRAVSSSEFLRETNIDVLVAVLVANYITSVRRGVLVNLSDEESQMSGLSSMVISVQASWRYHAAQYSMTRSDLLGSFIFFRCANHFPVAVKVRIGSFLTTVPELQNETGSTDCTDSTTSTGSQAPNHATVGQGGQQHKS